jgi:hypothetical protein
MDAEAEAKSFFSKLFDFSFNSFITMSIIKWIFILALIGQGIVTIIFIVGGFAGGVLAGLGALIISPIVFLLLAIITRVYMELIIVAFRIALNTSEMVRLLGGKVAPTVTESGTSPPTGTV